MANNDNNQQNNHSDDFDIDVEGRFSGEFKSNGNESNTPNETPQNIDNGSNDASDMSNNSGPMNQQSDNIDNSDTSTNDLNDKDVNNLNDNASNDLESNNDEDDLSKDNAENTDASDENGSIEDGNESDIDENGDSSDIDGDENTDESENSSDMDNNDFENDESKELDANDLNGQSFDDSEQLANDLPHHHANPDEDASKEDDAAEHNNPDEDASKENDATQDSVDDDSTKENDATQDNVDDDSKKENDASNDSVDDDSKKDQDDEQLEEVDPNNNDADGDDEILSEPNTNTEKGIQKGAEALGYGDEAKGLQTAKNLSDSLKNAKGASKEKLQSAAKELGETTLKGIIKTTIISYGWPIILAVAAILLIIFFTVGMFFIMGSGTDDDESNGCSSGDAMDASASITSSKDADKNAETIYKYLKSHVKGSNPKAIAGLLGNMWVESAASFDAKTIQGNNKYNDEWARDPGTNGYAFGIAQWDGGRRVNLIKYGESKGKKWDDLGIQLDFLLNHDGSDSDLVKKLLKSDDSVESNVTKFLDQWERGDTAHQSLGKRQAAAKKYYAKFADIKVDDESGDSNLSDAADAGGDNSDACGGDAEGKTDGTMGASVEPNGAKGNILKVWNSKKEIPEKYRKVITLPDFSEKALDVLPGNPYVGSGNRGQCTEFTWGYMSQLWSGKQTTGDVGGYTDGNGQVIWKAYKNHGAKITKKPTVGYGFSGGPPIEIGGTIPGVGHTGVVVGVLEDGKYIIANYNLRGEANRDHYTRSLTYALVDGQPKSGQQITFFSGIGKPKVKVDKK